jgi:hypothetical protein
MLKCTYVCHYLWVSNFELILWFGSNRCYMRFVAQPITKDYMSQLIIHLKFFPPYFSGSTSNNTNRVDTANITVTIITKKKVDISKS